MERNSTDVIIEDKVYKISTDQDASYVRELAEYINEKMELLHRQSAYSKQANAFRQIILLMNMADDYCRMKQQAEEATRKYEQQEAEFYNMKREMVNMQMTIASLKKQLQEKPKTQAVCPYLQSLAKEAEAKNTQTAQASQEKKQYPPYGSFANRRTGIYDVRKDMVYKMDISAITALNNVNGTATVSPTSLTGMLAEKEKKAEGTMFETFLNTAIDNVKTTNSYLSDAENEKIRFALGETDNTHDLTIAMGKASTALQYTVAIRDKVMEAYKELMQIQI